MTVTFDFVSSFIVWSQDCRLLLLLPQAQTPDRIHQDSQSCNTITVHYYYYSIYYYYSFRHRAETTFTASSLQYYHYYSLSLRLHILHHHYSIIIILFFLLYTFTVTPYPELSLRNYSAHRFPILHSMKYVTLIYYSSKTLIGSSVKLSDAEWISNQLSSDYIKKEQGNTSPKIFFFGS